jgi:tRNA nucleotidyltransferase/poly(A) polymerase
MREDGVLSAVLPEAGGFAALDRLVALDAEADPLRRLAALVVVDGAGAAALARRLRLSNPQAKRLAGMARPWPFDPLEGERRALYRLGSARYGDLVRLAAAAGLLDAAELGRRLARAAGESPPVFPLAGRDVAALGIPPGPRVGRLLAAVRQWWEEGGFAADRARCRERLAALAAEEGDRAQPEM